MKKMLVAGLLPFAIGAPSAFAQSGLPDLTVVQERLQPYDICELTFKATDCALDPAEGLVAGPGTRRLLRFDTVIENQGTADLVVGDPSDPNNPYHDLFVYSTCHGHYHIKDFAKYELLDANGNPAPNAYGHKQAFCLEDSIQYDPSATPHFTSCATQGITVGWADLYARGIPGQWIDITGVPQGTYTVRVTVNANTTARFLEGDYSNNSATTTVSIPNPHSKVKRCK